MKNLIKTLGFILVVAWPSVTMAININQNTIYNKVCIESNQIPWWKECDDVENPISNDSYACSLISSTWSVVKLDSHGDWSMKFTCAATTASYHTFNFDCGNWNTYSTTSTSWFASYTCHYTWGEAWLSRLVSCVVDSEIPTNPSCNKTIYIDTYPISECWNGIIEGVEDCDFYGMNMWQDYIITDKLNDRDPISRTSIYTSANGYYCNSCKLIKDNDFVNEPVECLYTDKPISIMNNEIMPFWWRLSMSTDTLTVTKDRNACDESWPRSEKTLANPTTCHFAVYNWKHKQWDSAVQTFKLDCYNENFRDDDNLIYEYFRHEHQTDNGIDWASIKTINALTDWNATCSDNNLYGNCQLWEYKIVLETVDYDVCIDGERRSWRRSGPVCEVNAAITRPYAMQISTFNASPIGASEDWKFLRNFYDINWSGLLDSRTDLAEIIDISEANYSNENNVQEEIDKFRDKYGKLAVKVGSVKKSSGNGTISVSDLFPNVQTVKKVPNQHIYFLEWNGKLKFSQDKIKNITSAYTIFVSWMDVEIEWDVLQYAMIITTERMSFKDAWSNNDYSRCASWWQVVQWLYVAWKWFEAADGEEPGKLRNTDTSELWCAWWWLHVKWALIWDGIDNIVKSKRSQLNSRFNIQNINNIKRERRQKIIWWASVLIEYSPSLWKTLPPWAEFFTESLEVYRK